MCRLLGKQYAEDGLGMTMVGVMRREQIEERCKDGNDSGEEGRLPLQVYEIQRA